jgi:hypothetical protein
VVKRRVVSASMTMSRPAYDSLKAHGSCPDAPPTPTDNFRSTQSRTSSDCPGMSEKGPTSVISLRLQKNWVELLYHLVADDLAVLAEKERPLLSRE